MIDNALKILIVEDDRLIATVLKMHVATLGHQLVGIVASGEEAVQQSYMLQPQLIIMDINLEGELNGVDAAKLIQSQIETKIIFISGDEQKVLKSYRQITSDNYMSKPISREPLALNITRALKKAI